jgi:hypothetical protein
MSLRQGDFHDLECLTIQKTVEGVVELDVEAWNGLAFPEAQRTSHLLRAPAHRCERSATTSKSRGCARRFLERTRNIRD